jgi:hypothetical protein
MRIQALAVTLSFAAMLAGQPPSQLVTSFEDAEQMKVVVSRDTRYELTAEGVTDGAQAMRVYYSPVQWPALFFRPPQAWDLSAWGEIAMDVTNPESETLNFSVRVDDDLRADGTRYCRTGSGTIEPGATATFSFPIELRDANALGMRGWPVWDDSRNLGSRGSWTLETAHIVQFQIFLASPGKTRSLIVDNVRFRTARPLDGIVDRFGQFTGADWPGKLYSEEEFAARREAEAADLAANPVLAGRDRFGGWAGGPQLEATGFFRTEKLDGKWWLVSPDGTLFFSVGPDSMRPAYPTFLTAREAMFTWLPEKESPLSRHFGRATSSSGPVREGATYDFHSANLERKYGYPFAVLWRDTSLARLPSWGFNTIANWSDATLHGRGVPYVTTTTSSGSYNQITVAGASARMPDAFDPAYAAALARLLRTTAGTATADPMCLGHFVDNELPWGNAAGDSTHYGVPLGVLAQKESPARSVFVVQLRERYGEVQALNRAWGSSFAAWGEVAAPAGFNAAIREDFGQFLREFARQYFRIVREQVKAADPNHLYLGARFSSYNTEAVEAAAEFADVVSFNIYQQRIDPARWAFMTALDRPAIIGEFHFGALDRGMFHTGLVAAPDQAGKARMYEEYLRSVLVHPAFVGAHWFQFYDQPLTGRTLDGENYNIGFLTVTDTPYPEMIEAVRRIHAVMYSIRAETAR